MAQKSTQKKYIMPERKSLIFRAEKYEAFIGKGGMRNGGIVSILQ